MLTIGKRVYWTNNGSLRWGEIVAINATDMSGGIPKQIVVDDGNNLLVLSKANSWEQWYETAAEAIDTFVEGVLRETGRAFERIAEVRKQLKTVPPEEPQC